MAMLPLLRTAVEVHADETFKVVPEIFYQLFTIHTIANGKVISSLNWIL
jgi:hypothetical protein